MRGNPVGYRNLYKHLRELLSYLEISLDADFVLEELDAAYFECEKTFGRRHVFTSQIRGQLKDLYHKYIDNKALPLSDKDAKKLREKVIGWLKKYYKKPPL